jgi:hypothetical protein
MKLIIIGNSGSGKTWLATHLAAARGNAGCAPGRYSGSLAASPKKDPVKS